MAAIAGPVPRARATWVWDRPAVPALVDFARRHGVRDLFVSAPGDLGGSGELPWFRDLARAADAADLRLQALGAEVWWLDDPAGAEAWQRQVLAAGLFDGVHLDVEPWGHPLWGTGRDRLLTAWVAMLARLAAATDRPVETDMAFWLHEHRVGERSADEAVMAAVDAVTVLSYRNRATGPDSITSISAPARATAARLGTPLRLAVETRFLGSDPGSAKQTFHGSTPAALEREMAVVDAAAGADQAYVGLAVHDAAGWAALSPSASQVVEDPRN